LSILIAILGIGFLIFVHELGHFLACRLTKTRTETFSIGFGPRLFGWENLPGERKRFTWGRRQLDPERHAMDFRVAVIPLGGYVKMAGENPGERSGKGDEFPSKPTWARVFIICAGVIMNVITAGLFYAVAYAGGVPTPPALVGEVAPGQPAWAAGVRAGDRLERLDGHQLRSFIDLMMEGALLARGEPAPLELTREGKPLTLTVTPAYDEERGALVLGIAPARGLRIVADGRRLDLGAEEPVVVAGVPARGGAEALELLSAALAAGVDPVVLERAGAEPFSVSLQGRELDPAPTEGAAKLQIEPWGHPRVDAVRTLPGRAADAQNPLKKDDVIVEALLAGGRRLSVDGTSVLRELLFRGGLEGLVVERGGARVDVPLSLASPAEVAAFLEDLSVRVEPSTRVRPTTAVLLESRKVRRGAGAAAAAGIQAGERVVQVAGKPVATWEDLLQSLRSAKAEVPLTLRVKPEDGPEREVTVVPSIPRSLKGLEVTLKEHEEPFEGGGLLSSIGLGVQRTAREVKNVFRQIGAFFTGTVSFSKNIGGPKMLGEVAANFAETSWLKFIQFLAYISVSLAVLNILPIPILDGGHLLFILMEKIKGAPLKESTIGKMQMVGLVLVLALLAFALKNDFTPRSLR
jgi:regulator of sigma E protease